MKMNKGIDLDNLKESWKNDNNSTHTYSQVELVQMLNKKSTNNVKYLVIISIIEFIIISLSIFMPSADKTILSSLDSEAQQIFIRNAKICQYLSYINIAISFIFVFYLLKSYKKINVLNTTKEFINNILKFRKTVTIFIIINIIIGIIILFLTGFYSFMAGFRTGAKFSMGSDYLIEMEKIHTPLSSPKYMLLFIIICIVLITFVIIYYLLVYGILLKRLKINLKELQKIDK